MTTMDWYLQTQTSQGWRVVAMSETAAQLEKPKEVSALVLLFFFLGVLCVLAGTALFVEFYGGAVVFGILAALFHSSTGPQLRYVTLEDARAAQTEQWAKNREAMLT